MLAEADRILAVFQALLRISNIEKGNTHPLVKEVDLGKIIHDVTELYEPLAEERQISLHLTTEPDVKIRGDHDLLFQLFANVLDNAIKFAPPASQIKIAATADKDHVTAYIEDAGVGIADDEKEKVFKHFYRVEASRSKVGNGLGLSLVRAIAEQHRAQITLEDSKPGLRVKILFQPYQKFRIA